MTKYKFKILLSSFACVLFLFNHSLVIESQSINDEINIESNGSESQDWFKDQRSEYESPLANEGTDLPPPPDPPENIIDNSSSSIPLESNDNDETPDSSTSIESNESSSASSEGKSETGSASSSEGNNKDETPSHESSTSKSSITSTRLEQNTRDETTTKKPSSVKSLPTKESHEASQQSRRSFLLRRTQEISFYIKSQSKILLPLAEAVLALDFLPIYDNNLISVVGLSLSRMLTNILI